MESLEKAKQSLSAHCDDVVVTLAELNGSKKDASPTPSAGTETEQPEKSAESSKNGNKSGEYIK